MMHFLQKQQIGATLRWMNLLLVFPFLSLSGPFPQAHAPVSRALSPDAPPVALRPVFEGPYLSLYSSGRLLRQDRHRKSGVWDTPARKVLEMWVKRTGDTELIRLDPGDFRRQLVELLADYPEIHGAIRQRSFTYKNLSEEVPNLNDHIDKVIHIRKERVNSRAK